MAKLPRNESAIIERLRREIKKAVPGALVWKIHGSRFTEVGRPDLYVSLPEIGQCWIETKFIHSVPRDLNFSVRSSLTQRQWLTLMALLKSGARVRVLVVVGDGKAYWYDLLLNSGRGALLLLNHLSDEWPNILSKGRRALVDLFTD